MGAMYFHVFSKKRCKFCVSTKKLLEEKKLPHVITYVDSAPQALDELKERCQWETVPIIFEILGDKEAFVGGYTDLEEYLNGEEEKDEAGIGEGVDPIGDNS